MRLRLEAPAKLNLTLEILGRRPDGFHEIRSVVQTISLFDTIEATPDDVLQLIAPDEAGPPDQNLVLRAARLLQLSLQSAPGARLELHKTIPVGAGLGGGSSDAAATLRLLARLWGTGHTSGELESLGLQLGSDVPLFLRGSASLLAGRGAPAESLPVVQSAYFVLVLPPLAIPEKTARVYAALRPSEYTSGAASTALAGHLARGAEIQSGWLVNGLWPAACRAFPGLKEFQRGLEQSTEADFHLSGAGPALFHVAASGDSAERVAALARPLARAVYVARPLTQLPVIQQL